MPRIYAQFDLAGGGFPTELIARPLFRAMKTHGYKPVAAVWRSDLSGTVELSMVGGKPVYANRSR